MRNENTMKYVISALLGVGLFGFLYIIMEVITFYSFPRMLGSIAVALIGGGAIGTILQRLPDKDEKNAWKYYAVCFLSLIHI